MSEELEHIKLTDGEYVSLLNWYKANELQAMLRLLNHFKSQEGYEEYVSDYKALRSFIRDKFEEKLRELKDERIKLKYPIDDKSIEKIIDGMYRAEDEVAELMKKLKNEVLKWKM